MNAAQVIQRVSVVIPGLQLAAPVMDGRAIAVAVSRRDDPDRCIAASGRVVIIRPVGEGASDPPGRPGSRVLTSRS